MIREVYGKSIIMKGYNCNKSCFLFSLIFSIKSLRSLVRSDTLRRYYKQGLYFQKLLFKHPTIHNAVTLKWNIAPMRQLQNCYTTNIYMISTALIKTTCVTHCEREIKKGGHGVYFWTFFVRIPSSAETFLSAPGKNLFVVALFGSN